MTPLAKHLQNYDSVLAEYLINGFKYGFWLGCREEPKPTTLDNHIAIHNNYMEGSGSATIK